MLTFLNKVGNRVKRGKILTTFAMSTSSWNTINRRLMKIKWSFYALLLLNMGEFSMLKAQEFKTIRQAEDTLASASRLMLDRSMDDSSRKATNQFFYDGLHQVLSMPGSEKYPFDSLKTLVKISSPDNKFRIFHWNMPGRDGKQHYFGFIKMLDQEPPVVFPLIDISDSLQNPDVAFLDHGRWLGALYYKVISCETSDGKQIYTLLGWAGRSPVITQKVIEILWFDEQGNPHFGSRIFNDYKDGTMSRIIFRYSAETSMSLKYETRDMIVQKGWNSKKREFNASMDETQMIICERMVPLDPQLEGQYQFYVAAGDIYDGFVFKEHRWSYIPGIDARNKK